MSGGSSLPTGSTVWIQENTNSGLKETCAIIKERKVCLRYNLNGYWDDFHFDTETWDVTATGYVAEKYAEVDGTDLTVEIDSGNTACYLDDNNELLCGL